MLSLARFYTWILCGILLAHAIGCGPPPHCTGTMLQFNVSIAMDDSLKQQGVTPRVEVDLVGVNASDTPKWSDKSLTDYFTPGDALRNGADPYIMRLDEGSQTQTLKIDDKQWAAWKSQGTVNLFILSPYPRAADAPGTADPRRLIIPLDCSYWDDPLPDDEKNISIVLKSSGLSVVNLKWKAPVKPGG